jgi:hypothetical protein
MQCHSCLLTCVVVSDTGATAVCEGSPPNPANGEYNCGRTRLPGDDCFATCNPGFVGRPQAACGSDGTWQVLPDDGTVPDQTCEPEREYGVATLRVQITP